MRRIYDLFTTERHTEAQIATVLNAQGILNEVGKPWTRGAIHELLTNETSDEELKAAALPVARPGPYRRRRQRRMNRDPRNWTMRGKGEYFIVEGREIWCHPDDLAKLKRSLSRP